MPLASISIWHLISLGILTTLDYHLQVTYYVIGWGMKVLHAKEGSMNDHYASTDHLYGKADEKIHSCTKLLVMNNKMYIHECMLSGFKIYIFPVVTSEICSCTYQPGMVIETTVNN